MNIAIAGFGIEGAASYRYWSSDPINHVTIYNESLPDAEVPEGANIIIGENAFEKMNGYDIVVRTAGLAPSKIKTDGKVWSATNEFFAKCPARIIGVTGTKGKGTTASLIASILEAAGKKVWLLGNIGTPALDHLKEIVAEDIVVYELSSFQLWDLEKSPQASVILMIEPDHLNVHDDFDQYVDAKANIRRFQQNGDICVYNPDNEFSSLIAAAGDKGKAIRYGVKDDGGVYVKAGAFCQDEQKICSIDSLQLIGQHNIENACAAITIAKYFSLTDQAIETGLLRFHGLPHRLEFVRELDGVKYYNDSFSSAPGATIAAVRSFSQPEVLILGGIDKGADFSHLMDEINSTNNIKLIILIGEIRHKLAEIIKNNRNNTNFIISDFQQLKSIVELARSKSEAGDVIILSPACASFDMFKNFYERGNQFRDIVNGL